MKISSLVKAFANHYLNVDLQQKNQIYLSISEFVQRKTQEKMSICLPAVYRLCGEQDKALLGEDELFTAPVDSSSHHSQFTVESLVAWLQKTILQITVSYQLDGNDKLWTRTIKVYFLEDRLTKVIDIAQRQRWHELPSNVRAEELSVGHTEHLFVVYHPIANSN